MFEEIKNKLEIIRRNDRLLLLGVTGGIASGKSTVAHMLRELGAYLIDLDHLARQVVEPGKPAWKEIVAYFGAQILQEDGHIDRSTLSKIVFRDAKKRKKLEGLTHYRIFEAFVSEVTEIAEKDPEAVIQGVVPLLVEINVMSFFHKIILVYIPQELQMERLVRREGISPEDARNILEAQMPIDEKLKHADFVIHNEHSIEQTRRQVEDLWQRLRGHARS
jgi:dephospho-CoA kinase